MIVQDTAKAKEELLTIADLNYIRLSIVLALQHPDVRDMPNIEQVLEKLYKKIYCLCKEEANR
jgi:hypothetical protein